MTVPNDETRHEPEEILDDPIYLSPHLYRVLKATGVGGAKLSRIKPIKSTPKYDDDFLSEE